MSAEDSGEKKTRKKRRPPGSERVAFILRMEPEQFKQLNELLEHAKTSRNDFICDLVAKELEHLERFRALNADPFETPASNRKSST